MEALERALKCNRGSETVVVLFIDLDRFKQVNDSLGHLMGDDLLKAVAGRLRDTVRQSDIVARLGGDEFVVMQTTSRPAIDAAELAARIVAALSTPFNLAGQKLEIGASVGIAVAHGGGEDSATLLSRADAALYQSKAAGGTGYCFFGKDAGRHRELIVYAAPPKLPLAG